jgi:hypothetical protein
MAMLVLACHNAMSVLYYNFCVRIGRLTPMQPRNALRWFVVRPPITGLEWDRNNFPIGMSIKYSTTGQAGGYLTDSALESTHQPVQPLGGSYCNLVPLCIENVSILCLLYFYIS